jgi:HD-GYP domain-containing protein (c-di-GMP phosphodiesterase class II)
VRTTTNGLPVGAHCERACALGLLLAEEIVPREAEDPQMTQAFLLHDVGKLAVPYAVLAKPGTLDLDEFALVRAHPEAGRRLLYDLGFGGCVQDVALCHHERWDGRGYPQRLLGEQIPLWARIFAVADTVDAMTSDRPYRRAAPLEDALTELRRHSGRQFDPVCVDAFLSLDPDRVAAVVAG